MTNILAEDYSGLTPFFLCGVPILILLTLMGYYFSWRGHWSGPILAAPLGLMAILLIVGQGGLDIGLPQAIFVLTPIGLSAGAVALWLARRGGRAEID